MFTQHYSLMGAELKRFELYVAMWGSDSAGLMHINTADISFELQFLVLLLAKSGRGEW